ncbi:MAG: helix-turn-helix domain-containing protein [bacterium]|nr:helix-turn-helix domain-containing protein [bacterium]
MAKIDPDNLTTLIKIGLTPDEAKIYSLLVTNGSLSSEEIAEEIKIFPNAVYRLAKKLLAKKFIVDLSGWPKRYQAIPPKVAIETYVQDKLSELEELKTISVNQFTGINNPTQVETLTGKNAMFEKYLELANKAKQEILIFSLGEPVNDEIKLVNRDALERGVTIKLLAQISNKNNHSLLDSWRRMGLEVRHYPAQGFHLVIIDSQITLLTTSNPKNPLERITIVFPNTFFSQSMCNYFNSLWEKSTTI